MTGKVDWQFDKEVASGQIVKYVVGFSSQSAVFLGTVCLGETEATLSRSGYMFIMSVLACVCVWKNFITMHKYFTDQGSGSSEN